jgi:hypothetical protein
MPVEKYRDVADMPRVPRAHDSQLPQRITALWRRATQMAPPNVVAGVQRFRSIEEANVARERATSERMRGETRRGLP